MTDDVAQTARTDEATTAHVPADDRARSPAGGYAPGTPAMPTESSRDLRAIVAPARDVVGEEIRPRRRRRAHRCSVTLIVLGPWLLGTATNLIVDGTRRGEIDYGGFA